MQENHRNGQEENDIVATSGPYTRLRKQRIENCILTKSYQFSLIQCFLKFLYVQSRLHRECYWCTKINLSDQVFTPIIVTIANGKDMGRLCLNAQCSLITTTTWPTSYFYYFFSDKIFVTVDKKAGIFTKHLATLRHTDTT